MPHHPRQSTPGKKKPQIIELSKHERLSRNMRYAARDLREHVLHTSFLIGDIEA